MNEVYLLSKLDVSSFFMIRDFQGNFADFEQFKIDSNFASLVQSKLTLIVHLYWLWVGHSCFTDYGQEFRTKKQSKPSSFDKNSKSRLRTWHKSCSMIRSVVIRSWILQLINRLQGSNLLSVTRFADLCDKVKYAW